jgi:hypothetical protein
MEEIMDLALKNNLAEDADYGCMQTGGVVRDIDISAGDISYHDDEFFAFYGEIAGDVESAIIDFEGEDGSRWRHECKDGKWQELQGEIVYNNPTEIRIERNQELAEYTEEEKE